jgi:hypothetical protein
MWAASEVLKNGGTWFSKVRLIAVDGFIKFIGEMALPMAFLLHVGWIGAAKCSASDTGEINAEQPLDSSTAVSLCSGVMPKDSPRQARRTVHHMAIAT